MIYAIKRFRPGLTLIELILAVLIGIMISLIVGVLLYSGQRNWTKAFDRSNKGIEVDAYDAMTAFGSFGRRSNCMDYAVYTAAGSFVRSKPSALAVLPAVVSGNAVEFRYWDTPLNAAMMDSKITATHYMLFYLNGTNLMVDEGPYVIENPYVDGYANYGGVANNGTAKLTGAGVGTRVLAQHVTSLQFSHTAINTQGDGDGCVRMTMVLTDPADGRTTTVKTATLLRSIWGKTPRHN